MAYNLGPVKAHVKAIAERVGPQFGIQVIHGWRPVDRYPDHPSGLALDYMTSSMATGNALAEYHIANAGTLGVKYLIWNDRDWNPSGGWSAYQPNNPARHRHRDHVHVTYLASGSTDIPLANGTTALGVGGYADTLAKLNNLFSVVGVRESWIRVAMFIGGVLFVAIGVIGVTGVQSAVKDVIKGAK